MDSKGNDKVSPENQFEEWELQEDQHEMNKPIQPIVGFAGPSTDRGVTDWVCVVVFTLISLALGGFTYYCMLEGDPYRLIYGSDFRGEICGMDDMEDLKYLYVPNPTDNLDLKLCLDGCPIVQASGVVCLYEPDHTTPHLYADCYDAYESRPYINRWCLPADEDLREDIVDYWQEPNQIMTRILGDMFRTWDIYAVAGLISLGVMFVGLLSARFGCLTTLTAGLFGFISLIMFIGLIYLIYIDAERSDDFKCADFGSVDMEDCDGEGVAFEIISYILAVILLFLTIGLLCIVSVGSRVKIILKYSIMPLKQFTSLLLVLLVLTLAGAAVLTWMMAMFLWGCSIGDIENEDEDSVPGGEVEVLTFSSAERVSMFLVILVGLWWLSFIAEITHWIASSVACYYYFGHREKAVFRSIRTLWLYHFGSILLSSIVTPMLRLPRTLVAGIKGKAKAADKNCVKCLACSCWPCCKCHEKWIKYITDNTAAYQALFGDNFFTAARKSYFLVKRGPDFAHKLMTAGDYAVWALQLLIVLPSPLFGAYWIHYEDWTFYGENTNFVSSVTIVAFLCLVPGEFLAQIFGNFLRGLIHGTVVSYLVCLDMDPEFRGKYSNEAFDAFNALHMPGDDSKKPVHPVDDEFEDNEVVPKAPYEESHVRVQEATYPKQPAEVDTNVQPAEVNTNLQPEINQADLLELNNEPDDIKEDAAHQEQGQLNSFDLRHLFQL